MSFASRFQHRKFNINTDGFEYKSLADLFNDNGKDAVYSFYAVYINRKSKYGDAPVVATADSYVNLPKHTLNDCTEMIEDAETVKAINDGKCGFKIYQYHDKRHNRDCFGVEWVDVE